MLDTACNLFSIIFFNRLCKKNKDLSFESAHSLLLSYLISCVMSKLAGRIKVAFYM